MRKRVAVLLVYEVSEVKEVAKRTFQEENLLY